MTRRRGLLAAGVLLLAACGERSAAPTTPVVLIVVDTLRADRLGCYGAPRPTSPHLDALAADGILFAHARSQAPWTTASIGSLMTSQYPETLHITGNRSRVDDRWELLAEALQAEGYRTGAAVSHIFCNHKWGFDQGFDEFEDKDTIVGARASAGDGVTAWGLDFLGRQQDPGFFLWLHYFDPHFSYLEHEGHTFPRSGEYTGAVRPAMESLPELTRAIRRDDPAADRAELLRIYDSEVAYTDAAIGRLLDELERRDWYDRALIVFTADHGEEFLEHGQIGHTVTLYDEVLHVPLVIKPPHATPRVVERSVGLVDVYPTILALLDAAPAPGLQGRSLFDEEARPVFSQTDRKAVLRSVVERGYKLIWNADPRLAGKADADRAELYALDGADAEQENLVRDRPEVFQGLKARLDAWHQGLPDGPVAEVPAMTDAERRALEEQGYGQGDR